MARAADPAQARAAATEIVARLRSAGHVAYFAGGCVRDELLGLRPTDYDVATDAPPQRIRELFPRTAEVGAAFGVMLVHMAGEGGGVTVEVATFRAEGAYSDARRPDSVRFSDAPTDAARRDFTINALFLDPLAAPDTSAVEGHVVDYVGGLADLRAGVVRAVGDPHQRLAEDHLRALRAARFAARLNFALDPATADAIRQHAAELRGVSRERIGEEVRRMMTHPSRARAAELLGELTLDVPVLEEPPAARASVRCLAALTDLASRRGETPEYPTCLAAWAIDRGHDPHTDPEPLVTRWRRALVLSNAERDGLRNVLVGFGVIRREWAEATTARQRRIASHPAFGQALLLLGAWENAGGSATPGPTTEPEIRQRVAELASTPPGIAPAPLVTGDDLVAMGLKPGKAFKRILDTVYDAQLEGRIRSKTDGMELVRRLRV